MGTLQQAFEGYQRFGLVWRSCSIGDTGLGPIPHTPFLASWAGFRWCPFSLKYPHSFYFVYAGNRKFIPWLDSAWNLRFRAAAIQIIATYFTALPSRGRDWRYLT
jgi:hypothetical protein